MPPFVKPLNTRVGVAGDGPQSGRLCGGDSCVKPLNMRVGVEGGVAWTKAGAEVDSAMPDPFRKTPPGEKVPDIGGKRFLT